VEQIKPPSKSNLHNIHFIFSNLLRLQIANDRAHRRQYFVDERARLVRLERHEVTSTLESDFDECVARHVLNAVMGFVHEFEQFVDNGFQEFPMGTQEARVLTHHIHDVRCDNRFVIFACIFFCLIRERKK
jgi:hypothetical protein